jgi:NADH:ubiquinone oxidoreductase subunit 2 (subunit N)
MLVIALLVLLLAVPPSSLLNYNYLADYVKFNRIVFITFILSGYIAYNIFNVDAISAGIGIYGGVFKITTLSQVFDIFLLIIGGIVTILTCFIPYNFRVYDDSKLMEYFMSKDSDKNLSGVATNFKMNFRNSYYEKLVKFYPYNDTEQERSIYKSFITIIKKITKYLPEYKMNTAFLLEKKLIYPKLEVKEFSFLLLYTVLGGSLLISSINLISLYLSLELQSFTLYIISTSQIRSFKGTSGGLKYFLLGGLSSGFILLGCSLLYAYTGTLNLEDIFMIYSNGCLNYILDPCLLVLFAGLLFKISAAPFHNWAPDVYSDVPTYTTTWLIIIAKLSIFILMLILIHNIHSGLNLNNLSLLDQFTIIKENTNLYDNKEINKDFSYFFIDYSLPIFFWNITYSSLNLWSNVLIISALLSLIIGTIVGLSQNRIKRLFAYSTITHVGFLLLALIPNTISSIDAFIFYLIQYTITNLNLFFILVAWGYLYCRYYLEKEFVPLRYLKINPYSWKDLYIEPTLYDYGEFIREKLDEGNWQSDYYNNNKNLKINTVNNHLVVNEDPNYYNFDTEDTEWLYTPVPFIINFKGMHSTDPFLAFSLSVTIFSLAGIPPMIGFFAKQQVLLASMQSDYFFISIVAIFTSVIGAAYYLRIIKFAYFYDDVFIPFYFYNINNNTNYKEKVFFDNSLNNNNILPILPSNSLSFIIAILTNISLFYIFKPYVLINTIYLITIPLFLN